MTPALSALANASIVYDQDENAPWLSSIGLYDGQVDSSADEAYATQLKELFLPRLLNYLEKQIQKGHKGGDLYHSFRIYLMFNKLEYRESEVIFDWFKNDWNNNMKGEASSRAELERHLKALLLLFFQELTPSQLNTRLVKQTRQLLLRVPIHQRIYSRIRTGPLYRQKIDLLNLFGDSVRDAFNITETVQNTLTIPYMFTKEGYDNIDLSRVTGDREY